MNNDKTVVDEDLKRLEDEAYFELCQIIAEAMQYQDIELLNMRIATWKNKYKKLLEQSPVISDFKKRIEYLLNQYYSSVTQYILEQLRLHEVKQIENQSKALRKLYLIIKNTNDLDLLKKKVKQWEEQYPVKGFLKMYQERIRLYTSEKNLKENAFEQEQAFSELVDITKMNGTFDEIKKEVKFWEKTYSINDKYSIDDFIKYQRDVKRYTSDEFLKSIARTENKPIVSEPVTEYQGSFSSLEIQASAYASLIKISNSPNNNNEMFDWVYKNNHIKFNNRYKELILNATYLNYSPTFLNKFKKPEIDLSTDSLTLDEYKKIDDIKKYAVISYFNLLLPPNKMIANDYFNKYIKVIYSKSERTREEIQGEKPEETAEEIKVELAEPKEPFEEIKVELEKPEETAEEIKVELEEPEKPAEEIKVEFEEPEKPAEEIKVELAEPKEPSEEIKNKIEEEELDHTTIVTLSPLFFTAINNYNKQAILINHIDTATNRHLSLSLNNENKEISEPNIKTKGENNSTQ